MFFAVWWSMICCECGLVFCLFHAIMSNGTVLGGMVLGRLSVNTFVFVLLFVLRATLRDAHCFCVLCAWSAIIISLVVTYGRNHGFLVVYMETI